MKKFLIFLLVSGIFINSSRSQCPPSAFAYQSLYPQCASGCGVLLLNWPAGVLVNIYGGTPLSIISSVTVTGTLGSGALGDAFTCVPCNIPLVFASSTIGATSGCVITILGTVPIKINSFSVTNNAGNINTAKWVTANEMKSNEYTVQRSLDGRRFIDLHTLHSIGGTGTNSYEYTDETAAEGTSFYRLKAVEITGNILYSETVAVKSDTKFGFSVFPNPASADFSINIATQYLPATIAIYNAQGVRVATQKVVQQNSLLHHALPKGVYTLKVVGNNHIPMTKKIVLI
jgi:hypothetical protein